MRWCNAFVIEPEIPSMPRCCLSPILIIKILLLLSPISTGDQWTLKLVSKQHPLFDCRLKRTLFGICVCINRMVRWKSIRLECHCLLHDDGEDDDGMLLFHLRLTRNDPPLREWFDEVQQGQIWRPMPPPVAVVWWWWWRWWWWQLPFLDGHYSLIQWYNSGEAYQTFKHEWLVFLVLFFLPPTSLDKW